MWGGGYDEYGGGYDGRIDRSGFATMRASVLADVEAQKRAFQQYLETAVFAPGATQACKVAAVDHHLTGAAFTALNKHVKARFPGCKLARRELSKEEKAAHPKYRTRTTKVVFADFVVSRDAQTAHMAAQAAAGGGSGGPSELPASKKAKSKA